MLKTGGWNGRGQGTVDFSRQDGHQSPRDISKAANFKEFLQFLSLIIRPEMQ